MRILTEYEIQAYREACHIMYDKLWDNKTAQSCKTFAHANIAYCWLAYLLCLPEEEAHFSKITDLEYFQIVLFMCSEKHMNILRKIPTQLGRCEVLVRATEKWLVLQGYRFPKEAAEIADKIIACDKAVKWRQPDAVQLYKELIEALG